MKHKATEPKNTSQPHPPLSYSVIPVSSVALRLEYLPKVFSDWRAPRCRCRGGAATEATARFPPRLLVIRKFFLADALNIAIATFVVLAGIFIFSGCKKSGEAPGQALVLFCMAEYVPQKAIDAFTRETGIRVAQENFATNEEMLAKFTAGAGAYDVMQPSEYTVETLVKQNLLLPLDRARIPNFKNLDPEFLGLPHDPKNEFSVPYMAGTVGIVVNTEKIHGPVLGYADVFQPAHRGRIVVVDDAREIVSWAMHAGGIPVNEVTAENLAKVRLILAQWLPLVKVFDADSPKTALLNGDCDLGIVWSGEGAKLFQENKKFRWVLPRDGAHRFIDSLVIPNTSRNKANAEAFIDFMLRPEISRMISDEFPYTNPNAEARRLLTPEQRGNPASYPVEKAKLETFRDIGPMAAEIDALMTDLRARLK